MSITFASDRELRLWTRLLELDDEPCWQRAQRRRQRASHRNARSDARRRV